jgi:hypothetical protein
MKRQGEHLILRILTAAAAVGSLAHVGVLIPRYIITDPEVPLSIRIFVGSIVVTVLAAMAGSVLALILVTRSWQGHGARSLALFLAAVSVLWGSILRFIDIAVSGSDLQIHLQASNTLEIFVLATSVIVASASFLRFSALFPAPLDAAALPPARRFERLRRVRVALLHARPVWLVAVIAVCIAVGYGPAADRLLTLITSGEIAAESVLATNAAMRRVWIAGLAVVGVVTLLLLPVSAMIIGMRNLLAGFRVAQAEERRRLLWLVAGTSIAGWMILVPLLGIPIVALTPFSIDWLPYVAGLLWVFAPAVLVGAVGVAIFYSGAVDPALVLKRSTIYGILGAAAFLLFTALESVLSNLFEATLGLPGLAGSIVAGCVAAGFMIPVRGQLARMSQRTSPAERADPGESTGSEGSATSVEPAEDESASVRVDPR